MTISYSSKAKSDLIQLNWRERKRIIYEIKKILEGKKYSMFQKMHASDYYKVIFPNHLAICSEENGNFNILTVISKQTIKIPE